MLKGNVNSQTKLADSKIYSSIIENMDYNSQKTSRINTNNLFLDNSGTSKKVFVVFDEKVEIDERVAILQTIDANVRIKYNYKYIPVVSAVFSRPVKELFTHNSSQFYAIKKILNLHHSNFEFLDISNNNGLNNTTTDYSQNDDNNQISLENWWLRAIGADNTQYSGEGVKIAILDTGISVHPDFFSNGNPAQNRIVASKNFSTEAGISTNQYFFDDYGHGTHVAGIAAGNGFLSGGKYRGVAPDALLYNAKISNSTGFIEEDDVAAAIEWTIENQVDIISMSFGDTNPEVWTVQTMAIQEAVERGIIAFSSVGNSGPGFFTSGTPASGLYSIAVGATDENNDVAQFSSWGPTYSNQFNPEISAPGVNIIAPLSKSSILDLEMEIRESRIEDYAMFDYIPLSGTSMACPMAAGAAALLLDAFPNASPGTIRNALIAGANPIESNINEPDMVRDGAGLINISRSLQILNEWNQTYSDVNHNFRVFPKIFPYAPFNFFSFPGDRVLLNYTFIKGSDVSIEIEFPDFSGIEFHLESNDSFSSTNKVICIPIYARIGYNATPGNYLGEIAIKNSDTKTILDKIEFNIKIKIPKAKIFFDSYHGLNDFFPSNFSSFSQIEIYHMLYQLSSQDYQCIFNMEHWTPFYNASVNAPILTGEILSNIDILVLQTPIIPYSSYEIQEITNFYNQGGSILFLGTLSNLLCKDSIYSLFDSLKIDIDFGDNLVNLRNNGYFSQAIPFSNFSFNEQSPLFTNISEFYYSFGTSFVNNTNTTPLISVGDKTIALDATKNMTTGKFLLFGDYHFLSTPIFTASSLYSNISTLTSNIFEYMSPSEEIQVILNSKHEYSANSTEIPLKIQIYDKNDQIFLNDFSIGSNFNISLIYPNNTEVDLGNVVKNESNAYYLTIPLESLNFSKNPIILFVNFQYKDEFYSKTFKFIHEIESFISPLKITSLNEKLDRIETNEKLFEIGNSNISTFAKMRAIIYPNSFFAVNNLLVLDSNISTFENKSVVSYNFNGIETAGEIILLPVYINNESIDRLDLYPSRNTFSLIDYLPEIKKSSSFIGNNPFTNLESGDYIIPIQIPINQEIPVKVSIRDYDDNPSDKTKFTLRCSLIPGIIYNNFFNPMFPRKYTFINLLYNSSSGLFEGKIVIPDNFQFSGTFHSVSYPSESDLQFFYTLAIISIIDPSGGINIYPILLIPYDKPIGLFNFIPIIILYGLIAVSIILLQKGLKWMGRIKIYKNSHKIEKINKVY